MLWMSSIRPQIPLIAVNTLLIVSVLLLLRGNNVQLWLWTIVACFLMDIYSPLFFGLFLLTGVITILITDVLATVSHVNNMLQLAILSAGSVLLFAFVQYIMIRISDWIQEQSLTPALNSFFWIRLLIEAVSTAVCVVILFQITNRGKHHVFER